MLKKLRILAPKSLSSRFILIIILPAILIQSITAYIFYARHWEDVSYYMQSSLTDDVNLIINMLNDKKYTFAQISDYSANYLKFKIIKNSKNIYKHNSKFNDLAKSIKGKDITIWQHNERENIFIYLKDKNLIFEVPRKRIYTPTTTIFMAWMFTVSAIFITVSLIFTKNQIRAITRLAEAAEAFGRGQDISTFKPEGAKEVKKAGFAFLDMKERIEQQVNQRTVMLAGVSHDLRTPLTRIKLALAMLPSNDETCAIQEDINEMQHMISEYLDFAKRDDLESFQEIDIIEFTRNIIKRYQTQDKKVYLITKFKNLNANIKAVSFRRAMVNIIDNGLRFGNLVEVTIEKKGDKLRIYIEDNGNGIPEQEHEKIFSAFYRSDYARNLKHSGAGLGLAISRDIINSHGGNIKVNKNNLKLKGASIAIEIKI
ncbi:MAG: ATP-binding protein [Sphingobacteriia bacterium]|nr:ATP-binding protein [Sphingobacteriia bacterium]